MAYVSAYSFCMLSSFFAEGIAPQGLKEEVQIAKAAPLKEWSFAHPNFSKKRFTYINY